MTEKLVSANILSAVCTISLNRENKLNSLTTSMLNELEEYARAIDANQAIKVVILTGAGTRAFCVGADIHQWSSLTPLDMWRGWVKRGHQVFDQWAGLRQPVIAAINGHAFGGGLELAITADIRISSRESQFALPEASIGTCPGWSGTQRLVRLVGASHAKYLALSGQRVSSVQALQSGLIHEVVDSDFLQERAMSIANDICNRAPVSVQLTKQLVNAASGEARDASLEAMAGGLSAMTQDAKEGIESFKGKRSPNFTGQ